MAVRKSERRESKLEVLYQATKLHDELCDLSYRCFGIYSRNNPLRAKHDRLLQNADADRIDHIIFLRQDSIETLAEELVNALFAANAIYPRSAEEYDIRLSYQNKAITICGSIKSELNTVARMFDCDISVFKSVNELLNVELNLIKKWKKSDRKRFSSLT